MSYTTVNGLLTGVADAIRAKDGTSAAIATQDMPAKIAAIPTGTPPKSLPTDWPDIHAIVEADVQTGYTYKAIVLLPSYDGIYIYQDGVTQPAYKFMDGRIGTSSGNQGFIHSYDIPTSEGYSVQWVIFYFTSQETMALFPTESLWIDLYSFRPNAQLNNLPICRAIDGETATGAMPYQLFSGNRSMFRTPKINFTTIASTGATFNNCSSLEVLPEMNLSTATNLNSLFSNCVKLTEVPDAIGTATAGGTNGFVGCYSLTKVPTNLKSTNSINFADLFSFNNRDSLATFNGSGNINGGLVYNINTLTTTQTITFNSVIKNFFTPTEIAKIAAAFTAKKWTVVW